MKSYKKWSSIFLVLLSVFICTSYLKASEDNFSIKPAIQKVISQGQSTESPFGSETDCHYIKLVLQISANIEIRTYFVVYSYKVPSGLLPGRFDIVEEIWNLQGDTYIIEQQIIVINVKDNTIINYFFRTITKRADEIIKVDDKDIPSAEKIMEWLILTLNKLNQKDT